MQKNWRTLGGEFSEAGLEEGWGEAALCRQGPELPGQGKCT